MAAVTRKPVHRSLSSSSSLFSCSVFVAVTSIAIVFYFQCPFLSGFISPWVDAYLLCSPRDTQYISAELLSPFSSYFSSIIILTITTIVFISFLQQWPFLSSFFSSSWVDAFALCPLGSVQHISTDTLPTSSLFLSPDKLVVDSLSVLISPSPSSCQID
ncbi:hypothetical protein GYMLUDRAFT_621176 [Collybiopsis luxurians FD-317 M1]|nr:hypothetical protein GYMLUDRAFT_621176 [Collybiopsis luxurians FD-317 M1]